ncbi:MAG TPA: low temperature requirement protein A [Chlamydiales bacterium]|jgi:low temperature requirement protein LtrA
MSSLWQKPRLHNPEVHRKISWLELFFDLVFVLIISELAHLLSLDISLHGLIQFITLFFPSWSIWMSSIYYNDRFYTEGLDDRLFTFLLMLPCLGLSLFAHHSMVGFVLCYIVARSLLIFLWARALRHEPLFRTVGRVLISGYSLSLLIFFASLFTSSPKALWPFAFFCDFLTPLLTIKGQKELPRFSSARLSERLGLFILIVLGETLVGIVRGVARHHHFSLKILLEATFTFLIASSLWWLYFDFIGKKKPKATAAQVFLWSFLHFPLVVAIGALAASALHVLISPHHIPTHNALLFITASLSSCLICLGAIEGTLQHHQGSSMDVRTSVLLKWLAAFLILNVGIWGEGLKAAWILGAMVLCLMIPIGYGIYWRAHREEAEAY